MKKLEARKEKKRKEAIVNCRGAREGATTVIFISDPADGVRGIQ